MQKKVISLSNHKENMEAEMQRILSNPPNEIMSSELSELFSEEENILFTINFEESSTEIDMDSFKMVSGEITRFCFRTNSKIIRKIMSGTSYVIRNEDESISFQSEKVLDCNCFLIDGNSYILEINLKND